MDEKKAFHDLERIFTEAVDRVNPENLIREQLKITGNRLTICSEGEELSIDLREYDRIVVLGAGKATAKMALAVEEMLGDRITEGLISVKYGHTEPLKIIQTIEAGHPLPDENSMRAAARTLELADRADEHTLILNLISGGGSALLASPLRTAIKDEIVELTLGEMQETTKVLLGSGATIEEMNCIRKHLSRIKGGRLAEQAYPAFQINLILSDVVGDRLDTIASGITTHDDTTYNQAVAI
jgi:hydroxypyruvate reductase